MDDGTLCSLACGFNMGGLLPLCSRTTGVWFCLSRIVYVAGWALMTRSCDVFVWSLYFHVRLSNAFESLARSGLPHRTLLISSSSSHTLRHGDLRRGRHGEFCCPHLEYTISDNTVGDGVGAVCSRIHAGRDANRRQIGSPAAEECCCL